MRVVFISKPRRENYALQKTISIEDHTTSFQTELLALLGASETLMELDAREARTHSKTILQTQKKLKMTSSQSSYRSRMRKDILYRSFESGDLLETKKMKR